MEIEKLPPYTIKRGSVYYYRRKVPLDVIVHHGSEVIIASLKTKELAEAKKRVNKLNSYYDELFDKYRNVEVDTSLSPNEEFKLSKRLTPLDFKSRVIRAISSLRNARQVAFNENKLEAWTSQIKARLEMNQNVLSTGKDDLGEIADISYAEVFVCAARHLLDGTPLPFNEVYNPITNENKATSPLHRQNPSEPTLEQLVTQWASEINPVKSTLIQTQRIIERFIEYTGKNRASQILKSDVVLFKDRELKGRDKALKQTTVNSNLSHLKNILGHALTQGLIESNPAQDVKIKIRKGAKDESSGRTAFSTDQLNLIFGTDIYTSTNRPLGGGGEASYWLPLLALFSGARLEELSQLRKTDIYEKNYSSKDGEQLKAWVIDINAAHEDSSLKNKSSIRIVPVHPALICLGLLRYLETIGDGYIFPKLNPSKVLKKRSGNWTKWFSRHLRSGLNITDERVVFHSFRHSFKHFARECGITTEVHHAITGHSMGNTGDKYGADHFPMLPLVEAMNKYTIPNLVIGNQSIPAIAGK